jgi:hypothetical protein
MLEAQTNDNTNEGNKMNTTSTTMTYREWLIDRNERLTRADKKEAARAYLLKEKEALAAREKAKNWNPSA